MDLFEQIRYGYTFFGDQPSFVFYALLDVVFDRNSGDKPGFSIRDQKFIAENDGFSCSLTFGILPLSQYQSSACLSGSFDISCVFYFFSCFCFLSSSVEFSEYYHSGFFSISSFSTTYHAGKVAGTV